MAETVLIEFIGNAKSGVAAADEQVAANERVATSAKNASKVGVEGSAATSAAWKRNAAVASSVGKGLTKYVSLPLVGIGAAATKMSLDFSKSMLLIETHTDTSRKMVDRYRKSILAMSASGKYTQGPKELSEAMYHVASDGYKGSKALDTLRQAAHLATLGQSNLAETTYALVSAEKLAMRGTTNLHDTIGEMNAIVGAGDLKMQEFVGSLSTGVLFSAKQAGASMKDFGAALDFATSRGVPAQKASYMLSMNFKQLVPYTEKAQNAFEALGLSDEALGQKMKGPHGFLDALRRLKEAFKEKGLTKFQEGTFESELFGGGRSSKLITGLLQNLGGLEEKYKEINALQGKTNKNLSTALKSPANVWAEEWAQLQAALVEVGNQLVPVVIPALKDVTKVLTGMGRSFNALSPGLRHFAIGFGLAAVAAGPLLRIVGGLTSGLAKVAELGSSAASAVGGLGAAGGEGTGAAALVSQPEILAAVAATAALGVGLVVLYKHSKTFRSEVGQLGHAASAAFKEISAQLSPLITSIGRLGASFNHLHGPIGAIAAIVKSVFGDAIKTAFTAAANVVKGFGTIFAGEVEVIRGVVELISDVLEGKFGKAWHAVETIFKGGAKIVVGIMETLTGPIRAILGTLGSLMSKAFSAIWAGIEDVFTGSVNQVIGYIDDLISAINVIPGIPHIGKVEKISTGSKPSFTSHKEAKGMLHHQHRARGGSIMEGAPSGDSVPAVLERGEYVLNRKAVAKIGRGQLDAVNFHEAPRLAFGGTVGEAIGSAASSALGPIGQAAKATVGTLHGAIGSLPSPHLPGWLMGVGGYLLKNAESYVKNGFQEEKFGTLKTNIPSFSGPWVQVMEKIAKAKGWSIGAWRKLIEQESGGNPAAVNPSSGAFGLGQFLGSTAKAYAKYGALSHDPSRQIEAMAHYIADRYGNPTKAWAHETSAGWYAAGGPVGDAHRHHRHRGIPPYFFGGKPILARQDLSKGLGQVILDPGVNMSYGKEPTILKDLKALSAKISKPVYVISGYRSPSHSVEVGGFADDPHTRGEAADIGIGSSLRESASMLTEGLLHSVNLDRPFYPASAAEINHVQLWHASGASAAAGSAAKAAKPPIPKQLRGKYTAVHKGSTSRGGGTYGEDVTKKYHVETGALTFPSVPESIHGCVVELVLRRRQIHEYRAAAREAKDKRVKKALGENAQRIQKRIEELAKKKAELVKARNQKRTERKIAKRGTFPAIEAALAGLEDRYNLGTERAEQLTSLEPEEQGVQSNFAQVITNYIESQESPAWASVLGTEASWRNTILSGENTVTERVSGLEAQIAQIESLKGQGEGKDKNAAWNKQKWRIPKLRAAISAANESRNEWEEQLGSLQGLGGPREFMGSLPSDPGVGLSQGFGGMIFDTEMSIHELGIKIKEAGEGGSAPEENTALIEALKQQAETARREQTLAELQYGPLSEFIKKMPPFLGAFKTGGTLPADGFYYGHKDETVIPAGGGGGDTLVNVHLHGDIAGVVDARIDSKTPDIVRMADKQMGARYRRISLGPGGGRGGR